TIRIVSNVHQIFHSSDPPPKKSRGKGLQGKKTADTPIKEVKVFEESDPEPAKRKTSSKRRVKKNVTLSADDNIISNDPNAALELAKSTSQTKAEEAKAARKVHATHARIVTESVLEYAKKKFGGKSSKSEAADIMQALKERKKSDKRQSGTRDSHKGTGTIPRVPDESTVVSTTSSEGSGTKPGVPNEEKDITKKKVILEWGDEYDDNDDVEKDDKDGDTDDEGSDHVSDTQDADDEDDETKSDDDIYNYKIRVRKDEDEEMINVEVGDSDKESIISSVQQTPTPIPTQPIIANAPTITTVIPESNALTTIELRVTKLEKDVSELKTNDHFTEAFTVLKSQVPTVVDSYLDTKVEDVFQKE
nr:hypothetical protein [Tanacetum cinerariifolium]